MTDQPPTAEQVAAAIAWFREDPKRLDFAPITEWSRHLRTIVRAYLARPAAVDELEAEIRQLRADLAAVADAAGCAYPSTPELVRTVQELAARPAAGRDLTAYDVRDVCEGEEALETWPMIADHLNGIARPAVARTDGQPRTGADLADQRRRERETGTGPFRDDPLSTAERMGAAPANDTAVQGWGDVESADFIERARAATTVGSFTAQFDHVYDPSGDLVCESVDHSPAVRIAAALSAVPADDTAAPVPYDDPEKET